MSLLGPRLLSGVGAPRAGRAPQAQSLVAGAQRTVKVKVAAQVQPVLPPPVVGSPFTPVEFDGMTVTPYVDGSRCQGHDRSAARQAYSLKATGVRASSRGIGRPAAEHKDTA